MSPCPCLSRPQAAEVGWAPRPPSRWACCAWPCLRSPPRGECTQLTYKNNSKKGQSDCEKEKVLKDSGKQAPSGGGQGRPKSLAEVGETSAAWGHWCPLEGTRPARKTDLLHSLACGPPIFECGDKENTAGARSPGFLLGWGGGGHREAQEVSVAWGVLLG